jgi:cell division transport system permease protein
LSRTDRLKAELARLADIALGDRQSDRVVPAAGAAARITAGASAAMAVLAVFALALSVSTGRLAERWSEELSRVLTIRVAAPAAELERDVTAVLAVIEATPGIAGVSVLSDAEQAALLTPWLGPDLPIERLPLPRLIEVVPDGLDVEGLRMRLAGEVPGAVLDDHSAWRAPLVEAAGGLRTLGWSALLLIAAVTAAVVTLAAEASLAANAEIIRVLRLIGARDFTVARAFTRRFTIRALAGAAVGTVLGMVAVMLLPSSDGGGFLTELGFSGTGWLAPLLVPPFAGLTAFLSTRRAALRALARTE